MIIQIKPLSVNNARQGKRFKTQDYTDYQNELLVRMPVDEPIPPQGPYAVFYEFWFSNPLSDRDNPVKPLQDVLQKKYKFNDKDIWLAVVEKKIVPKGKEYVACQFYPYQIVLDQMLKMKL